jgi:hemolysin III
MMSGVARSYSRAEYLSDAVVHAIGVTLAVAAIPVLVVLAAIFEPSGAKIAGAAIYGATMIAMLGCSAAYNILTHPEWAGLLARLDHSAIYLKIAGTWTPFILLSGQGFALMVTLWGVAASGVALKVFDPFRFKALSLVLYLGMGWVGVIAGAAVFAALPAATVALSIIGGLLYTFGVVFHLWRRLPYHNTIWHIFVLTATLCFYAAVVVAVIS